MGESAVSGTGRVALPNHEPGDDRRASLVDIGAGAQVSSGDRVDDRIEKGIPTATHGSAGGEVGVTADGDGADVSWRGPGENGGVVGLPATEDRGRLLGRESLRRARVDRGRGLEVGAPGDLPDVGGLIGGGRPWSTGADPHPTVVVTRFGSGVDVARD